MAFFLYICLAASSFANISEIESTNLDLCQVEDEKLSKTLDELVGMSSLRTDMQGLSSYLRSNNSKNIEVILNPDHDLWFDAYDALLSQGEIWWSNHAINGASLLSIDDLGIMTKKTISIGSEKIDLVYETSSFEEKAIIKLRVASLTSKDAVIKTFISKRDLVAAISNCKNKYTEIEEFSEVLGANIIRMQLKAKNEEQKICHEIDDSK